ncbi:hypothetical protein MHW47_05890 [Streptomyces sp. OfavH-34-F]|uniref:hypothetical protein n=1 Tax=Streptomyces sp. OfavH-34-F TaxID=2917760 RepID=UPI001EF30A00|nr:hypothetical protein [Streptomyces sp. OfavH-34-F]MCG7523972.1 hypothetical protein [Streptomyces sp. OfavH-34-F]
MALVGEAAEVTLIPTTPELEKLRSIEAAHEAALGEAVAALALRRATLRDIATATGASTARVRLLLAEHAEIVKPARPCVVADDSSAGSTASALADVVQEATPPAHLSPLTTRHPAPEDSVTATRDNSNPSDRWGHEPEPTGALGPAEEAQGAAALVRLAGELGLAETDVDELVYDMEHRGASDAYNSGSRPELGDLDAFDAVHDDADERASAINNTGLAGQVAALVAAFGEQETERMLRKVADSASG